MATAKVTLTVSKELLNAVDAFVERHHGVTRSGVCTQALRGWLQAQQDAEIEAYYLGLSDVEREEDAHWHSIGNESVGRFWP